jgi:hypothetical protein
VVLGALASLPLDQVDARELGGGTLDPAGRDEILQLALAALRAPQEATKRGAAELIVRGT